MGTVMASFSVASVVGVPLGLYLATRFGWHASFFFLAGFSTLVSPLIFMYVPSLRAHIGAKRENPFTAWVSVVKDSNQLRFPYAWPVHGGALHRAVYGVQCLLSA